MMLLYSNVIRMLYVTVVAQCYNTYTYSHSVRRSATRAAELFRCIRCFILYSCLLLFLRYVYSFYFIYSYPLFCFVLCVCVCK